MENNRNINLVRQRRSDDCSIACAAMIASVPYEEAEKKLGFSSISFMLSEEYRRKSMEVYRENGWKVSAQILSPTALSMNGLCACIKNDEKLKNAFDVSQRCMLILEFVDHIKPGHGVVADKNQDDIIFDPAQGIIRQEGMFDFVGPQSYLGITGFIAYCRAQENIKQECILQLTKADIFELSKIKGILAS
jgi:hypothetical protein